MTSPYDARAKIGHRDSAPRSAQRWALLLDQRSRLLRLARRLCLPADADDVVQEVLLQAAVRPQVDDDRLPGLLSTMVRRRSVDLVRARQRQNSLGRHRALLPPAGPGPEDRVCDRSQAQWLRERARELAPRERRALEARAAGLSTAATAARLGVSPRAAESILFRARAILRRQDGAVRSSPGGGR